ncbi:MAG: SAM hydroxide adenosyltransferase, partial [Flavobacteriales bacterium]
LFDEIGKNRNYIIGFRNYEIKKLSYNYSDVPDANPLALFNTGGKLEIAMNKGAEGHGGSASTLLGLKEDEIVTVTFYK